MFIAVDLTTVPPLVELREPADCKRFHVAVRPGDAELREALTDSGAGTLADDGEHVWVSIDAVRRMAAGNVGPGWDDDFAGMLAYAGTKGWVNDDGTSVLGHIEPL